MPHVTFNPLKFYFMAEETKKEELGNLLRVTCLLTEKEWIEHMFKFKVHALKAFYCYNTRPKVDIK